MKLMATIRSINRHFSLNFVLNAALIRNSYKTYKFHFLIIAQTRAIWICVSIFSMKTIQSCVLAQTKNFFLCFREVWVYCIVRHYDCEVGHYLRRKIFWFSFNNNACSKTKNENCVVPWNIIAVKTTVTLKYSW